LGLTCPQRRRISRKGANDAKKGQERRRRKEEKKMISFPRDSFSRGSEFFGLITPGYGDAVPFSTGLKTAQLALISKNDAINAIKYNFCIPQSVRL
jgi:hypothetical protein